MKRLLPVLYMMAVASTASAQVGLLERWEYATVTVEFTFRAAGDSTVMQWEDAMKKIVYENKKGPDGAYMNNMPIGDFWTKGINNGKVFPSSLVIEWGINKYVPFLNEMGEAGWDLVEITKKRETFSSTGSTLDSTVYFFKRQVLKQP